MTTSAVQITLRGLPQSARLETDIHEHVAWLEQFHGRVVGCRVLVEQPHRHRRDGRHFHVRIELTVPGRAPIVVSREPSLHATLKDLQSAAEHKDAEIDTVHRYAAAAVREAFAAARRRLQDVAREQRADVKQHATAQS